MATQPHIHSINSEKKDVSPTPATVSLKPVSPVSPESERLATDKINNLASAWDDVVQRTGTGSETGTATEPAFPDRKASSMASNMVILKDYDEDILTTHRMQTFVSAFPNRAATAKSVVSRIDTMGLGSMVRIHYSSPFEPVLIHSVFIYTAHYILCADGRITITRTEIGINITNVHSANEYHGDVTSTECTPGSCSERKIAMAEYQYFCR